MVSLVALFSPGFTISLYSLEKEPPKGERCKDSQVRILGPTVGALSII